MLPADRQPVIVGVGEVSERDAPSPREPARLMADAARLAESDAGYALLADADGLDIVNEASWPYPDPCGLVAGLLGMAPRRATYGVVGGESPVRIIHEAALRIASGESGTVVVCGAEADHSVRQARKAGATPDWSPRLDNAASPRAGDKQTEAARRLEVAIPAHVYPFYENAARAAWGQSFDEAQAESAAIWSRLSEVAATREAAWRRRPATADEVGTAGPDNRWIAWPYPKLMTANPTVNQGAAVILTSAARALAAGVPEDRLVHVWGGTAAAEPDDLLARTGYERCAAMEAALDGALAVLAAEGESGFEAVELYSCFPVVPKMARRRLGLGGGVPVSITGGLSFFGAPLNNYMSHAAVAMTQRLRAGAETGLLYGNGGYVSRHHALVLGRRPSMTAPAADWRITGPEQPSEVPVDQGYEGAARIETFTVLFDRDGAPRHGVVIARASDGRRLYARVADEGGIARLLDTVAEPVGATGRVTRAADGMTDWLFE